MVAVKDGVSWRPESYHVFNVTAAIQTRFGNLQYPIVTEYESLREIADVLADDGVVYGAKLVLERPDDAQSTRRIRGVAPVVIGKGGVIAIDPPHYRLDPADVEAALRDFDWGPIDEEGGAE
jgi:hypothetical protein